MYRRDEIRYPTHRLYGLEEVKTPRSINSRGAASPPWPRIAAVLLTVAWNQPHIELLEIPLTSRTRLQDQRPSPSPLAASAVQRRKMVKVWLAGHSASDKLPSRIRAPRAAPPSLLATMAGQRRQPRFISPHQCRSCRAAPPPLPPWPASGKAKRKRTAPAGRQQRLFYWKVWWHSLPPLASAIGARTGQG